MTAIDKITWDRNGHSKCGRFYIQHNYCSTQRAVDYTVKGPGNSTVCGMVQTQRECKELTQEYVDSEKVAS